MEQTKKIVKVFCCCYHDIDNCLIELFTTREKAINFAIQDIFACCAGLDYEDNYDEIKTALETRNKYDYWFISEKLLEI